MHIHTLSHGHMCAHIHTHTLIHVHMCTYIRKHSRACACVCVTLVCVCVCVCVYTCAHTYAHTHTFLDASIVCTHAHGRKCAHAHTRRHTRTAPYTCTPMSTCTPRTEYTRTRAHKYAHVYTPNLVKHDPICVRPNVAANIVLYKAHRRHHPTVAQRLG